MNFPLNSGKKRKLTVGMIIIILLGVMEPFVWLLLIPYGIYLSLIHISEPTRPY